MRSQQPVLPCYIDKILVILLNAFAGKEKEK